MSDATKLRAVADRTDALVRELGAIGDPAVRGKAEELVQLLLEFYGAGVNRMLELLDEAGAGELIERLANDPLVASILVLHGIHPLDVETRVARALDRVRPYLGSHGGDVTLVGVEDGVVRLRLEGSCHGCGASTTTVKLAVEGAIEEAAPEVTRIEVEGVVEPAPSPLLQISASNGAHGSGVVPDSAAAEPSETEPAGSWLVPDEPLALAPGELTGIELAGMRLIVCRLGDNWYAYRAPCPACGAGLETGRLEDQTLTCPACAGRYDVRRAGRSLDEGGPQLEPLPLVNEAGVIRIALPATLAS